MVNAHSSSDIVIVGGGLNGAALALALSRGVHRVTLVEGRPPSLPAPQGDRDWDARVYAYSPGNVAWLHSIGGWAATQIRAEPVQAMRVHGDQPAPRQGRLVFDALETGLPELAWIAENRSVQASLWLALEQSGVTIVRQRPSGVQWGADGTHVLQFAEGATLTSRLLVAADGANSWLRQQARIGIDLEDYHQSGVVANFQSEKPHRGIAWQWFRPDGVLAYLPLPGRRISIVWSTPTALVAERLAWSPETLESEVAAAGKHVLGALQLITPAQAFPLKRRLAHTWVRPGLVLLGDAAHTVHPLAGQGVNLGFRDSRLLAEHLASGGDPGEIGRLEGYALRRREDVVSMQFVTGNLKHGFYEWGAGFALWRNVGMTLTDRIGPLKQALMRHAVQ